MERRSLNASLISSLKLLISIPIKLDLVIVNTSNVILKASTEKDMRSSYLNFRLTKAEQLEIQKRFEGENVSKILRCFLLDPANDPRKREKAIATITT